MPTTTDDDMLCVLHRAASFPPPVTSPKTNSSIPAFVAGLGSKTDAAILEMTSALTTEQIAEIRAGLNKESPPQSRRTAFMDPVPNVVSRCAIITKTAARPENEDTHFNDGDLYGIFDGHNGKAVSLLCQDSFAPYFREEQQKCLGPLSHQDVATVFDVVVQRLHVDVRTARMSGGATSLVCFETEESIYVDVRGDCRFTLADRQTGEICQLPRAYIDMAHNTGVQELGVGAAQTAVHVMPGPAKPRQTQPPAQWAFASSREVAPNCSEESLKRWKIDNDNKAEDAHYEWMVFNLNRAHRMVAQGKASTVESVRALVPRFNANGWRLSQCGVQPTRSIGCDREQVTKQGQLWRFDVPLQSRVNIKLIMCCDGAEDNGAIAADHLGKLATQPDGPLRFFEHENLLLGAVNQPHRDTFSACTCLPSMMRWVADMARTGRICGPDRFWCKSIEEAAERLATVAEDEDRWAAAFAGTTEASMEELANIAIDYANVCGSADNVTFGFKIWNHEN